jgi:hypothetical protein
MIEVEAKLTDNDTLNEFYNKVFELPHEELAEACVDMYLRLSSIQSVLGMGEWTKTSPEVNEDESAGE